MEEKGRSRITRVLWAVSVFFTVLLLSLAADPGKFFGAQGITFPIVVVTLSVALGLLTVFGERVPRLLMLTVSLVSVVGYALGMSTLALSVPLLLVIGATAVAGRRWFALGCGLGFSFAATGIRILERQPLREAFGYELLATIALVLLMLALAENDKVRRELQRTQRANTQVAEQNARIQANQRRLVERSRISRRLHDELGHSLTIASLHSDAALKKVESESAATTSLRQIRRAASRGLAVLHDTADFLGEDKEKALQATLADVQQLVENLRSTGVSVSLNTPQMPSDASFPSLVLMIINEACDNAIKHADSSELVIWVRASADAEEPKQWTVSVRNDGIRPGSTPGPNGQGLPTLRAKAQRSGGSLEWGRLGSNFLLSATVGSVVPEA